MELNIGGIVGTLAALAILLLWRLSRAVAPRSCELATDAPDQRQFFVRAEEAPTSREAVYHPMIPRLQDPAPYDYLGLIVVEVSSVTREGGWLVTVTYGFGQPTTPEGINRE